jgi:hypothetical protein
MKKSADFILHFIRPQAGQAFTFWLQPQKVNKKGRR